MVLYRISDLMKVSGTTERAIRQLFSTNEELSKLKKEHIKRKQNKVYYDEVIYKWFVEYYHFKNKTLVSNGVADGSKKNEEPANPQTDRPPSPEIEALKQELEAERAKNQALQANFETASKEIDDLKRENGFKSEEIQRLLLIIQQEKQEKAQIMLMLPPPRKTIGEKIKSLFTRKDTHERV